MYPRVRLSSTRWFWTTWFKSEFLKKKKDFLGWRPAIVILYPFLFHSQLCLSFFLSPNKDEFFAQPSLMIFPGLQGIEFDKSKALSIPGQTSPPPPPCFHAPLKPLNKTFTVSANSFLCVNESPVSGHAGRHLSAESPLIEEISKHYYTEESTRYLANVLLKNDDWRFIVRENKKLYFERMKYSNMAGIEKLYSKEYADWSRMAHKVIKKWVKTSVLAIGSTRPNSLTLLNAMEKSNKKAADFFRKALTCGKCLSFHKVILCTVKSKKIFCPPHESSLLF